jgi:hypothetical protein
MASYSIFAAPSVLPTNTRAQAAQARGHRGLQRFGGARIGEARGQRARRHAMLDQRDDDGVEGDGLLRRRDAPRELQEGHVAQVQVAEDFRGQVAPAHGDPVGGAVAQLGVQGFLDLGGHAPNLAPPREAAP